MPELLNLIQQFYAHESITYELTLIEDAVRALLVDSSLGQIWLMRVGETLVGYFVLTFVFVLEFAGRCVVIDELFIVSSQRGKGYASRSLKWIEAICREMNCQAVRLEVEHANTFARELYLRNGFRLENRSIMTKPLRC